MKELTKQQQLIVEELKLLIALYINRLQQCGMTKEEATEEAYGEINYLLKGMQLKKDYETNRITKENM